MNFAALPANVARVRDEIARIRAAEGISEPVQIVAVTKGHPRAAVEAAAHAGLEDVGENRVQEALGKLDGPPVAVRWHLIGHLQTNKAKYVPGRFWMVQSVDSKRVAGALARAAESDDTRVRVLIQVNVAGEEQKSGCAPEALAELAAYAASLPAMDIQGLMTMAPFTDDEGEQRRVFAGLRRLRDDIATHDAPLRQLSMGMSGDYPAAVAEGATIVRLGTVLFGDR